MTWLTPERLSRPRSTPFRAGRAALAALAESALPFLDLFAHLRELLAQRIQLATAFSVALAKRSVLFLELRDPLLLRRHVISNDLVDER